MKMTKKQAGALGGLKTLEKYGADHMRAIGALGAQAFHKKYELVKLATSDFAIVERATGIPTGKTINGNVLRLSE